MGEFLKRNGKTWNDFYPKEVVAILDDYKLWLVVKEDKDTKVKYAFRSSHPEFEKYYIG